MSKNTLHTFGDSYTEGQPEDCTYPPFIEWKKLRGGNLPKSWSEILGEKLNMEVKNYGIGGNSNPQIFDDVCNKSHEFNKGDIVIINWTYKDRFRWAATEFHFDGAPQYPDENNNPLDNWRRMSVSNDQLDDFKHIKRNTKDEIIKNRTSHLYSDEIYNYENLIEQYSLSKGFDVYFWSTDNDIIINLSETKLKQKKYILNDLFVMGKYKTYHHAGEFMSMFIEMGGQTIFTETNTIVNDNNHFGELGHKVQAELFYEYIMSYRDNSI